MNHNLYEFLLRSVNYKPCCCYSDDEHLSVEDFSTGTLSLCSNTALLTVFRLRWEDSKFC